ncbi:MAG: phospho-N-acetylmuramoyl-pentapeptide-transferase, partial [Gammaproteobacteria bacterium]
MLLYVIEYLTNIYSGFNAFTYITLRAIMGALTALIMSFVLGPVVIRRLTSRQIGQTVRLDGPESHLPKAGTPTMGGALILLAILFSTFLWADLSSRYVWTVILVTMAFGLIGWVDDYRKLILQDPEGLAARWKFLSQSAVGLIAAFSLYGMAEAPQETALLIPYFKDLAIP